MRMNNPPISRFMTGDVTTRNKMLKLIPHIDSGNWVVRQAVGTKPVITGKVRVLFLPRCPSMLVV